MHKTLIRRLGRHQHLRLRCRGSRSVLQFEQRAGRGRRAISEHAVDCADRVRIGKYSEGGKFWDRLKTVAKANNCVPNMLQVLSAVRNAELRVFYPLHRRYRPGDYETWKYIAPVQKASWLHKAFEYGTWGGEIRREFEPRPSGIVALEHWCSSGFANADLDLQLKKRGVHQVIAHTCVEATVRYAAELGYEVTMVKDAAADYSDKEMRAALDVNIPNYASAIVTTNEVVDSIFDKSERF
jgi:ureidoacrylate peracid hydrolase